MPQYMHRAYQTTRGLIPPLSARRRYLPSPTREVTIFFPFNATLSKIFLKHVISVAIWALADEPDFAVAPLQNCLIQ